MSQLSRRQFLNRSVAAAGLGAGFAIGGTKSSGRVIGANDRVRIGIAGLNGRGGSHVDEFTNKVKGVEIAYLIDPDTRTFAQRIKEIQGGGGSTPQTVQDIRRALDDKNLDAVSVATPNHWHALITIWACQAGKDVYVEKPCSHNVHEGRIAVEAARKYGRIVQHGTQSRSTREWAQAAAAIRSGQLGKVYVSRGLCYKPRLSIGVKPNGTPPAEMDFNIWLGPAPSRAFNGNLVHYNWHWFWDFGNGDIGNQGVHEMDKARWMIPGATLPKSVISLGGRFGYEDQGETANTQIALFDYGDSTLIFEVRGLKTGDYLGEKVGNVVHLEGGTIVGGNGGRPRFYPKGSTKPAPLPNVETTLGPGNGNFDNFIAAVRSRKQSDLNADILEGHYSSALCHLANISYRLGSELPFHADKCALGDDHEAYEALGRMEEHLSSGNGLKLAQQSYRIGRKLAFDAKTERFVENSQADAMLTRPYRKPFEVPEKIA
jgi:predicted dehydrogenase